ncbi:hypothetical protein Slin14017_G020070 [Septoria linicola]|nr:hypothetical protein Slin14017_G020070 [Septoria linicola]
MLAFHKDLHTKPLDVKKNVLVIFDFADLFPDFVLRDAGRGGVELEFVSGEQEVLNLVVHPATDEEESVAVSGPRLLQACFRPAPNVAVDVQRTCFSWGEDVVVDGQSQFSWKSEERVIIH